MTQPNLPEAIRLLKLARVISTKEGFIREYFNRLPEHKSNSSAYWSVESDHMKIFERQKYNGHDVFASVLSRWNSKKRECLNT